MRSVRALLILGFVLADSPASAHLPDWFFVQPRGCRALLGGSDFYANLARDEGAIRRRIGREAYAWRKAGSVWGMGGGTGVDLASMRKLRVRIEGDPARDARLVIRVYRGRRLVRSVPVDWDPAAHAISRITERLPIGKGKGILLDEAFLGTLPPLLREEIETRRDALEWMSSRLAAAILSETPPFSRSFRANPRLFQANLEIFLGASKLLPLLRGKVPVRRLHELYSYLGPPYELLEAFYPGAKFHRTLVDETAAHWIEVPGRMEKGEALDLAVGTLFLELERNVVMYGKQRSYGMPFASSVVLKDGGGALNLHFLDLAAMNRLFKYRRGAPDTQWFTAHRGLQRFISRIYAAELGLDDAAIAELNRFVEENEEHLRYFFFTKEPPIAGKPVRRSAGFPKVHEVAGYSAFAREGTIGEFDVRGSFGVLLVTDPKQRFSMEAYSGYRPRYREGERVAELIRFGMDPELRGHGPRTTFQLASFLLNVERVDRVTLITGASYGKELVERFGFRKVAEKTHAGRTEWVLEMTPEDFAAKSLASLLDG